jgi:hypothetical protein
MTKKIGFRIGWLGSVALAWLLTSVSSGAAAALYETSFADGGKGWTAVKNATVSDVSRRTGGKSLVIGKTKDDEVDSAWLSPVLKNPGTPVRVSLWAADNYGAQKDPSYAAAFEVVPCDQDGKIAAATADWVMLPWDDKRQIPGYTHTLTRDGLRFKQYEAVKNVGSGYFRVRFCWPKAQGRGECYFTDVQVTSAGKEKDGQDARPTAKKGDGQDARPTASRYTLEISTPTSGNLFTLAEPLRFEFLLYATDGKPVGELKQPVIKYDITDYEYFHVATGTVSFAEAKPAVGNWVNKDAPGKRAQNLRLSAVLPDAAARAVGREFFIHAVLMDGDTKLAEDTVTYAVVNPRRITDPKDFAKCRFTAFLGIQNEKFGVSLYQDWDYSGWKNVQPVKGGPITIKPRPDFPKLVYIPNLEQMRGRPPTHVWGDWVAAFLPDWAAVDDPFNPGIKTFDIDGYVAYMVAFVRANRSSVVMVVPSGLERNIDARTMELQRKAYAALKKEFPDLPVGMMTWGMPGSKEDADWIMKEKIYEIADFFNSHLYGASFVWDGYEKVTASLQAIGQKRRMISTEFAYVGGNDQLPGSRDLIKTSLDAHAHDMSPITDFTQTSGSPQPTLRGEFPGESFSLYQGADRPRVSDAIADKSDRSVWTSGMPLLKTIAYYNFVQAVDCADFKLAFKPTERTIAYVYARGGKTICYLYLSQPNPATTLALNSSVPYTMQDIYGRTDRVTPEGASLVCATLDPLLLSFEGEVPALYDAKTAGSVLKPVEGGLALPGIARGSSAKVTLTVPPVFNKAFKAKVVATVDGTWPKVPAKTVKVAADKPGTAELPIAIDAKQAAGAFTFTTRLYDGDKLVSVLKQPLQVGEILTAQLTGIPMTKTQDPAVVVTVRSLGDKPMSGTVKIENRFFGAGYTAAPFEGAYTVGPRGTAEVRFPIPREQANLATAYEMRATITDQSGFTIACEDEVSFQACVKTQAPITIDGDLSDWKLDELLPIPYEKCWPGSERDRKEFSGRFYTRWDDQKLYFAAIFNDSTPVANGKDHVFWTDDNIMFTLYPWTWHMGEALNSGYYREHIGPFQGGKASIARNGYVAGGPGTSEGCEIVIKRTATGYVYEWSYPKASLSPLALEKGKGFRIAMSVFDQTKMDKKTEEDWGKFTWLTVAGFNTNVSARPDLWRQFMFVE